MPAGLTILGERFALKAILSQPLTLRLFGNDIDPGDAHVAADFDELSGAGYTPIALDYSLWTISGGSPSRADLDEQTFNFDASPGAVHGYYITASDGIVIWARRFHASGVSENVGNAGGEIYVVVGLMLD